MLSSLVTSQEMGKSAPGWSAKEHASSSMRRAKPITLKEINEKFKMALETSKFILGEFGFCFTANVDYS
ncbi:hypothetical protein GEV33_003225 [Tenebrio molitor]|uniref:Uncharacterized protein n=1 Tax=Tenebrio molitor TaxID=7067 RepID=A0A8J6HTB5_TENMO|nr:hypothetical protein GEV33_003225 [Tenebrio molitor]